MFAAFPLTKEGRIERFAQAKKELRILCLVQVEQVLVAYLKARIDRELLQASKFQKHHLDQVQIKVVKNVFNQIVGLQFFESPKIAKELIDQQNVPIFKEKNQHFINCFVDYIAELNIKRHPFFSFPQLRIFPLQFQVGYISYPLRKMDMDLCFLLIVYFLTT